MQTETFIEVKNLSRYYGSLCAVNDIEFEVKRGEVLGFLGPNGGSKDRNRGLRIQLGRTF